MLPASFMHWATTSERQAVTDTQEKRLWAAAALAVLVAANSCGQTLPFTVLHTFIGRSDGAYPYASLVLSAGTLYGTACYGGSEGEGTVFKVNTDGTGFATLHSFTNGLDGRQPQAQLALSGNTLYGTAQNGYYGCGTVFKVRTDGTGFATLYALDPSRAGATPAGLVLFGNYLCGTAREQGSADNGTVFKVNTDGKNFALLHSFTMTSSPGPATNSDGAMPYAGLVLSRYTLYGTTRFGGAGGSGTVFKVNTDGTGFTTLHSFTAASGDSLTNSDGAYTYSGLVLSGNTLYGTAAFGGSAGCGTVFKVQTNGTGFATIYTFTGGSDGDAPSAGLVLSSNKLYGTAYAGGSGNAGTVFKINTDGTGFTVLHSFPAASGDYLTNSQGAYPRASLVLSGNTLYGTTLFGSTNGLGTVFSLQLLPPPPAITAPHMLADGSFQFSLNTVTGVNYTVQYSTTLASWIPLVTLGGYDGPATFTDPDAAGSGQRFYRVALTPN